MNCPSCDCKEVATTWVQHHFPYGEDGVMLSTQVPMRTCLHCSGKWLDHVGEDIITKVIANHLSTVGITNAWMVAAEVASQRAKAFNICEVMRLMKDDKVAIEDMDEWCQQAREDYPCLFMGNVVEGLS